MIIRCSKTFCRFFFGGGYFYVQRVTPPPGSALGKPLNQNFMDSQINTTTSAMVTFEHGNYSCALLIKQLTIYVGRYSLVISSVISAQPCEFAAHPQCKSEINSMKILLTTITHILGPNQVTTFKQMFTVVQWFNPK